MADSHLNRIEISYSRTNKLTLNWRIKDLIVPYVLRAFKMIFFPPSHAIECFCFQFNVHKIFQIQFSTVRFQFPLVRDIPTTKRYKPSEWTHVSDVNGDQIRNIACNYLRLTHKCIYISRTLTVLCEGGDKSQCDTKRKGKERMRCVFYFTAD